uniref:Uncharacterized protein n=1 Tax=Tanacetum cinerariifolium TaxID=118510 RepID=A0A6L2NUK0_TANCI|nr:hypothetical protein [Tanacetum cinerariifolium]
MEVSLWVVAPSISLGSGSQLAFVAIFLKMGVLQIGTRAMVIENKVVNRVMSSPNHPTSNIEDAFFYNFSDYISASPDYFPALPRNTSSDSSNNSSDLVPIALPTLSLFHNDLYMKVMNAYGAIIPPQVPISPLTIAPPSSMLSPIFNPQKLFLLEELLPPKKRGREPSSSSTSAQPQLFEI